MGAGLIEHELGPTPMAVVNEQYCMSRKAMMI